VPKLLAVYAFSSRIQGTARADSDLDTALDTARAWLLEEIRKRGKVYGR